MTLDDSVARRAEERLAEAKAQLAAAEQVYREVVPCEHPTMTTLDGERFACFHCGAELPDPRGCQHLRIDNDTQQCAACGERMISRDQRKVTVLSAPNLAACTNPACSGDVADPNCDNKLGVYVPDRSQEREVPIYWDVTYRCERCRYDGCMNFTEGNDIIWGCGQDHRGDSIPIREGARA